MDEKIQSLLQTSFSDWQGLKELSQLDRATAAAVAADWTSLFQQHFKRYLTCLGENDLETLTRRTVLRREAPNQDWKRTYAKLSKYIREGTFYQMNDTKKIFWKYLIHIPQVLAEMPDVHLWNNILFMSVQTENGDLGHVRVFDCARLQELQALSDVRVAAVCGDTIYLLRPHAISANRAADMRELASVQLDAHLDWKDVKQWVSDCKYAAYVESRKEGEEVRLRISVHDSVSLQRVRTFSGPRFRIGDGAGFWYYTLDVHGDDVTLYVQSSEEFKDAGGETFEKGQWALSFNVRTGEQKRVLQASRYDACGMCQVVDHCLITGWEKSSSLQQWSKEGPGCAELGPDDHLDMQSPQGSIAKVGDRYLYVTRSAPFIDFIEGGRTTLRVHNPWKRWHITKDIIDVPEGEEEPATLAANEWFVVLLMERRTERSSDDEDEGADLDSEAEYTLKVARVADHAFLEHDVDSESSSGDYSDGDEEYEEVDEKHE